MAARLVLTLEVKRDIAEAYTWYQNQRSGLGEEFLRSVETSLDAILRLPELRAPVYENYRQAAVRRFPYCIFYEFEETTVTVFSIIHTARDRQNGGRVSLEMASASQKCYSVSISKGGRSA